MNDSINWEEELKKDHNNICQVSGYPIGEPVKSFKSKQGEQFYDITLECLRSSHAIDKVPVTFSVSKLKTVMQAIESGSQITAIGELRSKFLPDGKLPDGSDKLKLIMSVFTRNIKTNEAGDEDINDCFFRGKLGKIKEVRNTGKGRTVIDFTLKVPTRNGSSRSYPLPCIAWGHLAEWVWTLSPGDDVIVDARLQSREYTTKDGQTKTVNELSVWNLSVIDGDE